MRTLKNIEEKIKEIFVDLFGVEDLEYQDNFFDLEINSLLATQLLYRIKQEFNTNLSLQELFERPTIEQVAEFIIEESDSNAGSASAESSTENTDDEDVVDQLSDTEMDDLLKKLSDQKYQCISADEQNTD